MFLPLPLLFENGALYLSLSSFLLFPDPFSQAEAAPMIPKMPRFSWADLPIEILLLFLKNLHFPDLACFAAVCKSWRTAASENPQFQALRSLWPLFLKQPSSDRHLYLFSPAEDQLYRLNIPEPTHGFSKIYGVSMGCLITYHEIDGHFLRDLLFTERNRSIPLPQIWPEVVRAIRGPKGALHKAVLSSRPSAPNLAGGSCILGAIIDRTTLAFCRPGTNHARWSVVRNESLFQLEDIVFFKGLFYSVSSCGQIQVFKFDRMFRRRRMRGYSLTDLTGYHSGMKRHFFVKTAADQLFMVVRYQTKFGLYVLDTRSHQWTTMTRLGDKMFIIDGRMFILGRDDSVSAAARKLSARFGFRPNCIYFKDIPNEWQEFCFRDKKIRLFPPPVACLKVCPEFWFQLDA